MTNIISQLNKIKKIDLLSTLPDIQNIFADNIPEITLLTTDTDHQRSLLFNETRQFLREAGLEIGDSEPINLQLLCRHPNSSSNPTNLVIIRKSCLFSEPMKITSVFVL